MGSLKDCGQNSAENKEITPKVGRVLFGREDLTDFYHKVKETFFEFKMNKLSELHEDEKYVEVKVCGIWKIKKDKTIVDDAITVERLNINSGVWEEKDFNLFPEIVMYPMLNTNLWSSLLIKILWDDIFDMLGYYELKTYDSGEEYKGKLGRKTVGDIAISNIISMLDKKLM